MWDFYKLVIYILKGHSFLREISIVALGGEQPYKVY